MFWLPRKQVLVPTDFSDASVDAMHTALAMVEHGRCVHVLHVVEPVPEDLIAGEIVPGVLPGSLLPESDLTTAEEVLRLARHERLNAFMEDQEIDGLKAIVLAGEPAISITRYAKENDIDLIVMAAHGYERGERISMGSVTERVLHNADCPVLVLRPDRLPSGHSSAIGVRESDGFAPVENPSHIVSASPPE
jgi:nucleotide-binding universal stress UspA family protein